MPRAASSRSIRLQAVPWTISSATRSRTRSSPHSDVEQLRVFLVELRIQKKSSALRRNVFTYRHHVGRIPAHLKDLSEQRIIYSTFVHVRTETASLPVSAFFDGMVLTCKVLPSILNWRT